ncbi:D-glycerate dehydrogenase [Burkholderia sp. L27(2015)]|uniref:2-hydroxyacid dehydrogenase n=1 Tax=Burkholderia sp. L27(2015) TaxID=1641858 RepID=UPI00131D1E3E|nr:D-glycerate dehydrogenase [Burkholderia sp. L27(2015)]
MIPTVAVTRELPARVAERLSVGYQLKKSVNDVPLSSDQLAELCRDCDAAFVTATDAIDERFLEKVGPRLKLVASLSSGHDHIDLNAAFKRLVSVTHTPGLHSSAVADMGILLMLGAARRAYEGQSLIRSGNWTGWSPTQLLGKDLNGARLGIFGMGRIGREVAKRARSFGMEIHYFNRKPVDSGGEEALYHASLQSLLSVSDFLIIAAPGSPETHRIINAEAIDLLPDQSIVVNISRGSLIDDKALISALRSGKVLSAGLDVFENEPNVHPDYLSLNNVYLQPHQGSSTIEARHKMCMDLCDEIDRFFSCKPLLHELKMESRSS